jgi:2-dehydro-3-deoxygalactonokinase
MLCRHSVLLPRPDPAGGRAVAIAPAAFGDGLRLLRDEPQLGFAQALFAVRCRTVSGELAANDAASYLSGLVIAADVRDVGRRLYRTPGLDAAVIVVGDTALADLYARSLEAFDIPVRVLDGERSSLRGLFACRQRLDREMLHGA